MNVCFLSRFLLLFFVIRIVFGQSDLSCDHDFVRVYNSCFKLVSIPATYDEAVNMCRTLYGSNLASIHHHKENTDLSLFGDSFLIGLRYFENSSSLKWSDQSEVNFTRFDEAHLVNLQAYSGDCIIWNNSSWKLTNCNTKVAKFICKRPLSNNPDNQCPPKDYIYKDNGTIYSPGWPREYHILNMTCKYTFAVKLNKKIKAVLQVESLGTSDGCRDSMEVYEGWNLIPKPGARLFGGKHAQRKSLRIDSNKNVLHFVFFYCPADAKGTRTFGKWKIDWGTYSDERIKPNNLTAEGVKSVVIKGKNNASLSEAQIPQKTSEVHKVTLLPREKTFGKSKSIMRNSPPLSLSSFSYTGLCYQGADALQKCGSWCNQKEKEFGSCILTGSFYKCWCFERISNSALKVAILEILWWETSQRYYWYSAITNSRNSMYNSHNYPYFNNYWNYN